MATAGPPTARCRTAHCRTVRSPTKLACASPTTRPARAGCPAAAASAIPATIPAPGTSGPATSRAIPARRARSVAPVDATATNVRPIAAFAGSPARCARWRRIAARADVRAGSAPRTRCADRWGETCSVAADCCSNVCNDTSGECQDSGDIGGPGCSQEGETCASDTECCGRACVDSGNGLRCLVGGSCRPQSEVCTQNSDCCNSSCEDVNGVLEGDSGFLGAGYCKEIQGGGLSCRVSGEACGANSDCCSFACLDDGTGYRSCQFLGGCRPRGELCTSAGECCLGINVCPGRPDTTATACVISEGNLGRCGEDAMGPKPSGEVCDGRVSGSHDCCDGSNFDPDGTNSPDELCQETALGLYRCVGDATACTGDGQTCSVGQDCCSGICAPDTTGTLVCTPGSCSPEGASCTTGDDCCLRACNAQGVCGPDLCGADGTSCSAPGDCCSNVCAGDTCGCQGTGQSCTTASECCTGTCLPDGTCGSACLDDGQTCSGGADCCSGVCDPTTFTCGPPTGCGGLQTSCTSGADCCEGLICDNNLCVLDIG